MVAGSVAGSFSGIRLLKSSPMRTSPTAAAVDACVVGRVVEDVAPIHKTLRSRMVSSLKSNGSAGTSTKTGLLQTWFSPSRLTHKRPSGVRQARTGMPPTTVMDIWAGSSLTPSGRRSGSIHCPSLNWQTMSRGGGSADASATAGCVAGAVDGTVAAVSLGMVLGGCQRTIDQTALESLPTATISFQSGPSGPAHAVVVGDLPLTVGEHDQQLAVAGRHADDAIGNGVELDPLGVSRPFRTVEDVGFG